MRIRQRDLDSSLIGTLKLDNDVLERILISRGIRKTDDLNKNLSRLPDPRSLKDIDKAINRLFRALMDNESLLIVGDFDSDGASSTALMSLVLSEFGFKKINYLVPNRFEFGYGLSKEIVAVAVESKPNLIVTVDNGISSVEGVNLANKHGIDCIITDHHISPEILPNAVALINPNQKDCPFPAKNLAGVGVVFFFLVAFRKYLRDQNWFVNENIKEPNLANYLDLVAVGTISDLVPLDRVNRTLVHQGIKRIQNNHCRQGLKALVDICRLDRKYFSAQDIGYRIAPYLNAAGRLDDMSIGIKCLISEDPKKSRDIAEQLEQLNIKRKNIQQTMQNEANSEVDKLIENQESDLPPVICLFKEDWHEGIVGLIASRVKDNFDRPVFAFAQSKSGEIKGSARSIDGFHARDAIQALSSLNPNLILKFGGHAKAAGLTIKRNSFKAFRDLIIKYFNNSFHIEILEQKYITDGVLSSKNMNLDMARSLRDAEPWGEGFPLPSFEGPFKIIEDKILMNKHLKFLLAPMNSPDLKFTAIHFNADIDQWKQRDFEHIYCVYELDINNYRNFESLQLLIKFQKPLYKTIQE